MMTIDLGISPLHELACAYPIRSVSQALLQDPPDNGQSIDSNDVPDAITPIQGRSLPNDLDRRVVAISPASPSHRGILTLSRAPRSVDTTLSFDARHCYLKLHTVSTNLASKARALCRSRTALSKTAPEAFWYLRQN